MPCDLNGVWASTDRHENFDKFLEHMGLNMIKRGMAKRVSSTMEIKQNGSKFIITVTNPKSSKTNEIEIGQEAELSMANDKKAKVTPKWEGDSLVLDGTLDGKAIKVTRELAGADLLQTIEVNGITFKRYFKKN